MRKVDLKKKLKRLYALSTRAPVIFDVPDMNILMVDGEGDPNTAIAYREALEVLYAVSYALKFAFNKGQAVIDYAVMPLEGLWWTWESEQSPPDRSGRAQNDQQTACWVR